MMTPKIVLPLLKYLRSFERKTGRWNRVVTDIQFRVVQLTNKYVYKSRKIKYVSISSTLKVALIRQLGGSQLT